MNNQLILAVSDDTSEKGLIKQALTDTRIAVAPLEDLATVVSGAIERGCFYLGLNKGGPDKDALKMIVMQDCQRKFKSLTLEEVKLAIDNGVHGLYGEVRGIAPRDVYHWLNSYKRDTVRLEAVKEITEEIDWSPSDDDRIKIDMYTLENAWLKFRETGGYVDHGNTVYNILDNNGKINLSTEEKKHCMIRAKTSLLNYYAPEKHFGNDRRMGDILAIYTQIKESDTHVRIIGEAKRFALTMFFERLDKEGSNIYELFK